MFNLYIRSLYDLEPFKISQEACVLFNSLDSGILLNGPVNMGPSQGSVHATPILQSSKPPHKFEVIYSCVGDFWPQQPAATPVKKAHLQSLSEQLLGHSSLV